MTELLVSVRDAEEALAALAGGAAIIDVKEPRRGALGAADPDIWQQVVTAVDSRVPVSVALGEWSDCDDAWGDRLPLELQRSLRGVAFAKVGLAGCRGNPAWSIRWSSFCRRLQSWTNPVAVIYADWEAANAPSPAEVFAAIDQAGCSVILIDTFFKTGRSLETLVPLETLRTWVAASRAPTLRTPRTLVLAGSLTMESIPQVMPLAPDYIAVRGAACETSRESQISTERISKLTALLRGDDSTLTFGRAAASPIA